MKDFNTKRKILKDRSFPDSEQIKKHQDFDQLTKNYSVAKKVILKKIILLGGSVVGIATIATIAILNSGPKNEVSNTVTENTEVKKEICIQPPIAGKETPYTIYRISAKNGGVINYPTGSSISIPANAFVNTNGEPVGDSIDIKYREFHDPLEIFLSGIPMTYDSAGVTRTLESAGMLEILAFDKGNPLKVKDQTSIDIKMASSSDETRFNLYELDTTKGNWMYIGKDKVERPKAVPVLASQKTIVKQEQQTTTRVFKPELSDPQKFSIKNFAYDKNEFPELAAYDNIQFEVTGHNFNPKFYNVNWSKISVYSGDKEGQYIIQLKKADTTISVNAKPVFDKTNYSAALAKFEEQHNKSTKERDEKELQKQAELAKVNKSLVGYDTKRLIITAGQMAGLNSTRVFSVMRTGFYNADVPIPPILAYAFTFKTATEMRKATATMPPVYSTIFLVEKGKNTVFRFSKGEPVRCNPEAQNLMWTITSKQEVAFFRITDFRKLANGAENDIRPIVAKDQDLAFNEIKKFSE